MNINLNRGEMTLGVRHERAEGSAKLKLKGQLPATTASIHEWPTVCWRLEASL